MLLKSFTADFPILLHGEGSISTRSFLVGGTCGAGVVSEIEVTAKGVVVRREGAFPDIYIQGTGNGEILHKSGDTKPTQTQPQQGGKRG